MKSSVVSPLQVLPSALCSTVLIALVVITAGCDRGLSLVKVQGKVTVDGKPANGAVILFHPQSQENGSVSSAVASDQGTFSPVTNGEPGIPAGVYQVTVSWPDPSVKKSEGAMQFGGGEEKDAPDLLKGRYMIKAQSGLTATIEQSTTELPAFELTSR
jgi:hypothetical protein